MKHCFKLLTLAVALSLPSLASSVDFSNGGGTLAGTNAGLTLTGSTLISVIEPTIPKIFTGDLGTVAFSTGALNGGSLQMGSTFAAGGSFVITGNGSFGLPGGTIFSGTFDGPAVWVLVTLANGTHYYTLTGTLTGTWLAGATVSGVTVQLTINTGKGFFDGSTGLSSGNTDFKGPGVTTFGAVPEPTSMIYLGTGLISIAGLVRRKNAAVKNHETRTPPGLRR
jgi:hypothetical protein